MLAQWIYLTGTQEEDCYAQDNFDYRSDIGGNGMGGVWNMVDYRLSKVEKQAKTKNRTPQAGKKIIWWLRKKTGRL